MALNGSALTLMGGRRRSRAALADIGEAGLLHWYDFDDFSGDTERVIADQFGGADLDTRGSWIADGNIRMHSASARTTSAALQSALAAQADKRAFSCIFVMKAVGSSDYYFGNVIDGGSGDTRYYFAGARFYTLIARKSRYDYLTMPAAKAAMHMLAVTGSAGEGLHVHQFQGSDIDYRSPALGSSNFYCFPTAASSEFLQSQSWATAHASLWARMLTHAELKTIWDTRAEHLFRYAEAF
ncbi:hypothetical protein [Afifella aestuarii]|uniref:hypothetical protein n=1 Tax=Afifella aestuarii TaxID=1909496 RepID=UPI000FE3B289|nr:hypothetical protein [Afifella aestuarii]